MKQICLPGGRNASRIVWISMGQTALLPKVINMLLISESQGYTRNL
jgi:hypothetical protein